MWLSEKTRSYFWEGGKLAITGKTEQWNNSNLAQNRKTRSMMDANGISIWILEVRAQGNLLVFLNISKAPHIFWNYSITVAIIMKK